MDFEAYARQSSGPLLRFAVALTDDVMLAQDVVQEVLLRAMRQWDHIGKLSFPHAYVRRMVVNEFLSWRRKWGRSVPTPDSRLDTALPDPSADVNLRLDLTERLGRLPRTQRAAIVMRFFEDMPDAAIAEALGCREVTVRGYLHRGLKALRVEMDSSPADLTSACLEGIQQP